jgi:hypothetical protein
MSDYGSAEIKAAMSKAVQEIQPQVSALSHVMATDIMEGSLTEVESMLIEAGAQAGMAATFQVIAARGWINAEALLAEVGR